MVRNMRLSDMNLDVPVGDERRIEVVANGLPLWHGAQLAVDATIVSPVARSGAAQAGAAERPGRALANAAQRKRRTYPELVRARRCRLVVFGMEVGGRWGDEAVSFLRLLARARARDAPAQDRAAAQVAWAVRWSALLAVASQRAFAASLLELPLAGECNAAGAPPAKYELLADSRWDGPMPVSRLPLRA